MNRKEKRQNQPIFQKLLNVLGSFYNKIGEKQLTDEELRQCFTEHQKKWLSICDNSNVDDKNMRTRFAFEVQEAWKRLGKKRT